MCFDYTHFTVQFVLQSKNEWISVLIKLVVVLDFVWERDVQPEA